MLNKCVILLFSNSPQLVTKGRGQDWSQCLKGYFKIGDWLATQNFCGAKKMILNLSHSVLVGVNKDFLKWKGEDYQKRWQTFRLLTSCKAAGWLFLRWFLTIISSENRDLTSCPMKSTRSLSAFWSIIF